MRTLLIPMYETRVYILVLRRILCGVQPVCG
jgi:hypothetical protein